MKPMHAILLAAALAAAAPARADVALTTVATVDAGPESGGKKESKEVLWVGKTRLRRDSEGTSQVIVGDQKKALFIDHGRKTYSVIPLPIDLEKLLPDDAKPMLRQFHAMMKMDIRVTPSDERKKIGEWNTRKYTMSLSSPIGMQMDMTLWTTTDVKIDYAAFKQLFQEISEMFPGGAELAREMVKVDGVIVLSESTMGAMKRREELVSVEDKAAPDGTYDPPAGYKEVPFNPFASMEPQ